jgi:hypothetical protein
LALVRRSRDDSSMRSEYRHCAGYLDEYSQVSVLEVERSEQHYVVIIVSNAQNLCYIRLDSHICHIRIQNTENRDTSPTHRLKAPRYRFRFRFLVNS